MGSNPSYFSSCGDECPVEQVSWNDVQEFINKLNQLEGNNIYRLPTEAEWEYACRAGSTTAFSFGADETMLDNYAWYSNNSGSQTHQVGQKLPNAWGLYDIHGNVYEWVQDWYESAYPPGPVTDPTGPPSGSRKTLRGGSWYDIPIGLRCANRGIDYPSSRRYNIGFRLVKNDDCIGSDFEVVESLKNEIDILIQTSGDSDINDKLEDAQSKLEDVLSELRKNPPDNQAALGNLEGFAGEMEAAIDKGLSKAVAEFIADQAACIARRIALNALRVAQSTSGADQGEIADAEQFLIEGDNKRDSKKFKEAISFYKDALSKAESAVS
jgi:hypothetical protein